LKHLFYTGGWKIFENLWNVIISIGGLKKVLPLLELLLTEVQYYENKSNGPQQLSPTNSRIA